MFKGKDIKNQIFGRLTVIEYSHTDKGGNAYWRCQCECGKQATVRGNSLRNGKIKSCGCLLSEATHNRATKHNLYKHPLYSIWQAIKSRCFRKTETNYKNYGGRGISMDDNWKKDFKTFFDWAIENGYKTGLSIDRINNNGNYEPSNCRWTSRKTQQRNTRRNVYLTFNNETHCISEWAELYGIKVNTLYARLRHGWSLEKTLLTPVQEKMAV